MSGIYGLIGLPDSSRAYINTIGQNLVFEAANTYLAMHNAEMDRIYSLFIEQETEVFKERYKLPGGGRLQRTFATQAAAVKAYGSWDVAYPLEEFGAQVAGDRVSMAYQTVQELQLHLDTVTLQDIATVRHEILYRLFNNVQTSFADPINGTLAVEPLANGDGVLYPPVLGSESEAAENHYIETNYATASVSDTNNPYVTARNELEEHFGTPTGFGNVVSFINPAEAAKTAALTGFVDVTDMGINPGDDTATISGAPSGLPGRLLGRTDGVWIVEWRWIPATYILTIDMDAPKPLKRRHDPADVGLGRGLQLVSEDAKYPFKSSHFTHRFGIGTANRLNGVVLELNTGGTYSIPAAFQ